MGQGRSRRVKTRKPGWYVWDEEGNRPYIERAWPSEEQALRERADLLKYFPEDSPWQSRLSVVRRPPQSEKRPAVLGCDRPNQENVSGEKTPFTGCIGFDVAMEGTADRARGACTPLTNGSYNCER